MEKDEEIRPDDHNLLDYLIVIAKHRKLILSITLCTALITAIISFMLAPVYRAETKILPPQQGRSNSAIELLSQLGGAAGMSAIKGAETPTELYIELLQSRSILDRIIERFDLLSLYKTQSNEGARKTLLRRFNAHNGRKSNIIDITFDDEDPKRAADIANAFVEELINLNKGLAITEASQTRLFFKEQLQDTKAALTRAEERMRGFQEQSGAVKVEAQAAALIEGVADLRAQIASKEVQLKVMKTYATAQNPDLQKLDEELKGMHEQLERLEEKSGGTSDFMPLGKVPKVGTEYIRRLRDLKFNEALYELLSKQYEAAKIDEARDSVVIQIIDKAIPPEKKIKPKKGSMIIIGTLMGMFFSVLAAFFIEHLENSTKDPENRKKVATLEDILHVNFFSKGQAK